MRILRAPPSGTTFDCPALSFTGQANENWVAGDRRRPGASTDGDLVAAGQASSTTP